MIKYFQWVNYRANIDAEQVKVTIWEFRALGIKSILISHYTLKPMIYSLFGPSFMTFHRIVIVFSTSPTLKNLVAQKRPHC